MNEQSLPERMVWDRAEKSTALLQRVHSAEAVTAVTPASCSCPATNPAKST